MERFRDIVKSRRRKRGMMSDRFARTMEEKSHPAGGKQVPPTGWKQKLFSAISSQHSARTLSKIRHLVGRTHFSSVLSVVFRVFSVVKFWCFFYWINTRFSSRIYELILPVAAIGVHRRICFGEVKLHRNMMCHGCNTVGFHL